MTHDSTTDTAGAGSPAPAVSSAATHPEQPAPVDVVAPEARVELDRIRRRWAELPVDRAQARMPVLRRLLADLARRTPRPIAMNPPDGASPGPDAVGGSQEVEVPDLGPAVVVDQVAVLVWDAYAAGGGDGIPQRLAEVRRELG